MIINMMQELPANRYHLMTQTVIPRPIAWVLSENDDHSVNLAPFSFFNAICSDPALLMLSIGKKPEGEMKDTRRNLLSGRDCVVHIAHVAQAKAVSASAANLAYGESELDANPLDTEPFPNCPLPRLKDCSVAYHCKLYDMHEIGPSQQAIIYVEILQLYIADDCVEYNDNRYIIDAEKVNPLVRLGGAAYASLDNTFTVKRP